MALELNQQIFENIQKSANILIAFRKDWNGDSLSSSLALSLILKKLGKANINLVCDGFDLPKNMNFLPQASEVKSSLDDLKKFIIRLDLAKNKISDFSYNIDDDNLNIYITPKDSAFAKENIQTISDSFKYDLIFVVNSPDLESLGGVYSKNADFFYQTPIINIDHHPANENFGQINLVDLNATSASEVIFNLAESLGKNIMDSDIATCLLTGMIWKTKSFKINAVTPRTLNVASQLITADARHSEIIKNLYQIKTINTLKLWGRALARLRNDPSRKLVWTLISQEDFMTAGANENDLLSVADELIVNSPAAEIIVLLYEKRVGEVCCLVKAEGAVNALDITKTLSGEGSKDLTQFCLVGKTLVEAENEVIGKIKENLAVVC